MVQHVSLFNLTRAKAVIEVSITFMIDKSSWNLNFTKFNIDQYTVASWISFHTVGKWLC